MAYPQDQPPEIVKLLGLNPEISTAILRASIDEPMIQIFEDDMRIDLLDKFSIISGILGTTNSLTVLDVLKILVALLAIPIPVKACIDIIKFLWSQMMEALKPVPARKLDALFFEEIQRINVGLINLGETMTPPSEANPEGATMQEIGVDMQIVEEMEEVDTVLKKFMRDYCSEYGRHWTDWAQPREPVTTSLDGCGPNLASKPPSPPFRPHPRSSGFRRGSAPAGMSQKSEDEVAEVEEAPPPRQSRRPPFPDMFQFFSWYLTKGFLVKPPQQTVATPSDSEGQQPGNNSNASCLKTLCCCCIFNETENCEQAVGVTLSSPSPPSSPEQGSSSPPTASSSNNEMPVSTIVEAFDANEAGVSTPESLFRKTFKQVSTKLIRVQSVFPSQHIYENPGYQPDDEILDDGRLENINLEEPQEF